MLKKWSVLLVLLAALLLLVGTVQAANTKYEFNDVEIDGQTVEIEAAVKETKKSAYSVCSYYTDEYGDYLGQHANDVLAGTRTQKCDNSASTTSKIARQDNTARRST